MWSIQSSRTIAIHSTLRQRGHSNRFLVTNLYVVHSTSRAERGYSNVFKVRVKYEESESLVVEEIKSIVLQYLGGSGILPLKLEEEETYLCVYILIFMVPILSNPNCS